MQAGVRLNDYYVQNQLWQLQRALRVTDADKKQIEAKVLKQTKASKSQQITPQQTLQTSPPPVPQQYRVEDPARIQDQQLASQSFVPPKQSQPSLSGARTAQTQLSTSLNLLKKLLAISLIAVGGVWALVFMVGGLTGSADVGYLILCLIMASLGAVLVWAGIRLWRH